MYSLCLSWDLNTNLLHCRLKRNSIDMIYDKEVITVNMYRSLPIIAT